MDKNWGCRGACTHLHCTSGLGEGIAGADVGVDAGFGVGVGFGFDADGCD